jgi:hypothetical protein
VARWCVRCSTEFPQGDPATFCVACNAPLSSARPVDPEVSSNKGRRPTAAPAAKVSPSVGFVHKTASHYKKIAHQVNAEKELRKKELQRQKAEERLCIKRREAQWRGIFRLLLLGESTISSLKFEDVDIEYYKQFGIIVDLNKNASERVHKVSSEQAIYLQRLGELRAELQRLESDLAAWNRRHDNFDVIYDWLKSHRMAAQELELAKWFGPRIENKISLAGGQLTELVGHLENKRIWASVIGGPSYADNLLRLVNECARPAGIRERTIADRAKIQKKRADLQKCESMIEKISDGTTSKSRPKNTEKFHLKLNRVNFSKLRDENHQHLIDALAWITSANGIAASMLLQKIFDTASQEGGSSIGFGVKESGGEVLLEPEGVRTVVRVPSIELFLIWLEALEFAIVSQNKSKGILKIGW